MNEDNLIPYNDTVIINQKRGPRKWDFAVIHEKVPIAKGPIIIRENDGCPTGGRLESLKGCFGGMSDALWEDYKRLCPDNYEELLKDPSITLIFIKGGVVFKVISK